jgi:LPXTG-motif cell wall-anchored protein
MKKALIIGVLLTTLGAVTMATGTAASAQQAGLENIRVTALSAECEPTSGNIVVRWQVTAFPVRGVNWTVEVLRNPSATPQSVTDTPDANAFEFTSFVPSYTDEGPAESAFALVQATWADEARVTNNASLDVTEARCAPPGDTTTTTVAETTTTVVDETTTTTVPEVTTTTDPSAVAPGTGTLPATGPSRTTGMALMGLGLLLAGFGVVALTRRPEDEPLT